MDEWLIFELCSFLDQNNYFVYDWKDKDWKKQSKENFWMLWSLKKNVLIIT